MACNCGKRAPGPPPPPPPPPAQTGQTAASGPAATASFSWIPASGDTQRFGSLLEAQAARVRAGGSGRIVSS